MLGADNLSPGSPLGVDMGLQLAHVHLMLIDEWAQCCHTMCQKTKLSAASLPSLIPASGDSIREKGFVVKAGNDTRNLTQEWNILVTRNEKTVGHGEYLQ